MLDAAPLLDLLPAEFSTRDCRGVGRSDKVLARLVRTGGSSRYAAACSGFRRGSPLIPTPATSAGSGPSRPHLPTTTPSATCRLRRCSACPCRSVHPDRCT